MLPQLFFLDRITCDFFKPTAPGRLYQWPTTGRILSGPDQLFDNQSAGSIKRILTENEFRCGAIILPDESGVGLLNAARCIPEKMTDRVCVLCNVLPQPDIINLYRILGITNFLYRGPVSTPNLVDFMREFAKSTNLADSQPQVIIKSILDCY